MNKNYQKVTNNSFRNNLPSCTDHPGIAFPCYCHVTHCWHRVACKCYIRLGHWCFTRLFSFITLVCSLDYSSSPVGRFHCEGITVLWRRVCCAVVCSLCVEGTSVGRSHFETLSVFTFLTVAAAVKVLLLDVLMKEHLWHLVASRLLQITAAARLLSVRQGGCFCESVWWPEAHWHLRSEPQSCTWSSWVVVSMFELPHSHRAT